MPVYKLTAYEIHKKRQKVRNPYSEDSRVRFAMEQS